MIATAPRSVDPRRSLETLVLAGCGAVEALALAMLLSGPPDGRWPAFLAVVLHLAACVPLALLSDRPASQRWLSASAVLVAPGLGIAVAAVVLFARGHGEARLETRPRARRRPRAAPVGTDQLSPCDALLCGDDDERRAAVDALARRADGESITLLRFALTRLDPDRALDVALVLDEIRERAEQEKRARSSRCRP